MVRRMYTYAHMNLHYKDTLYITTLIFIYWLAQGRYHISLIGISFGMFMKSNFHLLCRIDLINTNIDGLPPFKMVFYVCDS